jgi:hypothetical protein
MLNRVSKAVHRRLAPSPVVARHMEYSMIYSEDDSLSHPSQRLLDLSIEAIVCARQTLLDEVRARLGGRFSYPDDLINVWPGEHYRLLAAMVQILKPQLVIEIGTAEGLSALCMLKYLSPKGRIVTFDLIPWAQYPRSCLTDEDFRDGRLSQIIGDLGEHEVFERYTDLLSRADLVFIDAAKDGMLERKLIASFGELRYESKPLFVLDDIRLWNMLSTWRELHWPKLDLTSFGHWCGTGICEPPVLCWDA